MLMSRWHYFIEWILLRCLIRQMHQNLRFLRRFWNLNLVSVNLASYHLFIKLGFYLTHWLEFPNALLYWIKFWKILDIIHLMRKIRFDSRVFRFRKLSRLARFSQSFSWIILENFSEFLCFFVRNLLANLSLMSKCPFSCRF